jgi:hypothetical protein
VPYEKAATAWQDPTHIRAMNENSWIYYTEWFWYLGWFEYRFEIRKAEWLDVTARPSGKEGAAFMQVVLVKRKTTPCERVIAQALQPGLPAFPEDAPFHRELNRACAPAGLAAKAIV